MVNTPLPFNDVDIFQYSIHYLNFGYFDFIIMFNYCTRIELIEIILMNKYLLYLTKYNYTETTQIPQNYDKYLKFQ